jgi:hypothetical protein
VCKIGVTKTCECVGFAPDYSAFLIDFEATVKNTGVGTFPAGSVLTVTDDAGTPGNTSDDVVIQQVLAQALAPNQTIKVSGQFKSTDNPPFNTVRATIENSSAVISAEAFGTACNPCPLDPNLKLTKSCTLVLESVAGCGLLVRVDFTGTVENTGNVPLLVSVSDSDTVPSQVLAPTLMLPGEVLPLSGSYYPSQANGGVTDPGEAMFSDTLTATGSSPLLAAPVTTMVTAHCPLCP